MTDDTETLDKTQDVQTEEKNTDGSITPNELPEDEKTDEDESLKFKSAEDLEVVYDIPVQISAALGKAEMQVNQILKLGRGAVVELDLKVGEAIDIYVNNRLIARGEVVVVEDRLGITMTEIMKSESQAS